MNKLLGLIGVLCIASCYAFAYDFVVDGVYYNITSRSRRTVEVTHWEEQTGEWGRPQRVHHHDHCSCNTEHGDEHLAQKHCDLIHLDEEAVLREKTAYIGKVIIPEQVQYKRRKYKVIGIGDGSFYCRKQLTEVELPSTITYIGNSAFGGCIALTNISELEAVKRIGFAAFRECKLLTNIYLSDSLKTIDVYAFAFCESLTQIRIPALVETFQGNIVFACTKLKSVFLPHQVPPIIRNDNGLKMDFRNITFYVPSNMLPQYQAIEFWRNLKIRSFD
jgi:hypothetical protein